MDDPFYVKLFADLNAASQLKIPAPTHSFSEGYILMTNGLGKNIFRLKPPERWQPANNIPALFHPAGDTKISIGLLPNSHTAITQVGIKPDAIKDKLAGLEFDVIGNLTVNKTIKEDLPFTQSLVESTDLKGRRVKRILGTYGGDTLGCAYYAHVGNVIDGNAAALVFDGFWLFINDAETGKKYDKEIVASIDSLEWLN